MTTCYFLEILILEQKIFTGTNFVSIIELSEFHKMVLIVMETTFRKLQLKIIYYNDYKFFSNNIFRESLQKSLSGSLK